MKLYIFKLFLLFIFPLALFFAIFNISYDDNNKYIDFYVDGIKYHKELKTTLSDLFNDTYFENHSFTISKDMYIANNDNLCSFDIKDKISINKSSIDELMSLPGIGEKTAKEIINYRNNNNGFHYLEEIKNVKGIKDKKYEKIKEFISL